MIQSNKHNNHMQHMGSHDNRHDYHAEKKCDCGPDCKCGCQEGKPCTCGSSSNVASGIANGVCGLIGACFICGAIMMVGSHIEQALMRPHHPFPAPQKMEAKAERRAEAMDKAIAEYIKSHPQEIIDSLEKYTREQQRTRERPQPKNIDAGMLSEILNDKTNHVLGNPKGTFVMIEFFDYNCGFCKRMNKAMADAVKKSDNIRWILMDAPIFGEPSELIAKYAYAAAKQGTFAEYHAALGDTQDKKEESLKEIGKKLGLDVAKLEKDAHSEEATAKLAKTREYTTKLGLSGVPMFVIDGKVQTGAFDEAQMQEYIDKANSMKPAKKKK